MIRSPAPELSARDSSPRARICARRSRRLPIQAPDPGRRRGSEEHDHAGRRRTGVREPAHRRSGTFPIAPGLSGNDRRFGFDVRGSLGRTARGARLPSAVRSTTACVSTCFGAETRSVQHHRAHLASVLAERGEWDKRVVGVSFDGTGYGDDGTIWGGEFFVGSLSDGFERVAHLRRAIARGRRCGGTLSGSSCSWLSGAD